MERGYRNHQYCNDCSGKLFKRKAFEDYGVMWIEPDERVRRLISICCTCRAWFYQHLIVWFLPWVSANRN